MRPITSMKRWAAAREKTSATVNTGMSLWSWVDRSTDQCACVWVVTDGLDSEKQAERTGVNSAPAWARPTCGCTRRLSAPWPAFIFRAQSYIWLIANVRLISLPSSAGPIWIYNQTGQCEDTKDFSPPVFSTLVWLNLSLHIFIKHTHTRVYQKFNSW